MPVAEWGYYYYNFGTQMIKANAVEFREKGYTAAKGFFSRDEVATLLREVERRMPESDTQDALTAGGMIFTANVFKGSEVVRKFISQQRLVDFLSDVAGGDLWVRWDQAVTKHPGAGVFRWHQDNGYNQLRTEHFQLWIALTESRNQNGALWLAPGSHKRGLLPHLRVGEAQMEVQSDVGETVCIDAQVGDVILFSSLMLHRTGPNLADSTRVAYVAEYMAMRDYDFGLKEGPYFVAAERGRSSPRFVQRQPGALSLRNQLMYIKPRSKEVLEEIKRPLRDVRNRIRSL
jgi:hypothetical protein